LNYIKWNLVADGEPLLITVVNAHINRLWRPVIQNVLIMKVTGRSLVVIYKDVLLKKNTEKREDWRIKECLKNQRNG
jgi:hypothetical protein